MADIKQAVRKMYDESGEYFSKTREKKYGGKSANWPITQKYLDRLEVGDRLLDVGCGSGRLLSGLKSEVEYLGMDFSKTLIEIAKKKYPDRQFVLADITNKEAWATIDKNYQAIFAVASLHHLPTKKEQIKVLRLMKQKLDPQGFMFISVWNLWNRKMLANQLAGIRLQAGAVYEIPFAGKKGRYVMAIDKQYLREMINLAGLEVEAEFGDQESGHNLVVIARKRMIK